MGTDRTMLVFLSVLLIGAAEPPAAPTAAPPSQDADGSNFATKKDVAELEKCLTDKLSQVGEVVAVPIEGTKTLMYRTSNGDTPMMIDLDPPTVRVTTKFAPGTRAIVKGCV